MKQATCFLLFLLVACSSRSAPPPEAIASTPARDLPVNAVANAQPTAVPQEIINAADTEYLLLTNIYERVAPSVVNIEVSVNTPHPGIGDQSRGSGFVYDLNGHIITNAHVVNDTRRITVKFNDGYVADATVVGVDLFSDLAVIKVNTNSSHLNPVTLAVPDKVKVGERAIAIGNPFGLASSMTVGIVSGLGRQLPSADMITINEAPTNFNNPSIIQVDTDINPGNSGGPLLNSHGEVIGVNTAIRTQSGVFEGVGFAVPVSTLLRVAPELIEKGHVEYAWLGISSLPADAGGSVATLAEPLKLPVSQGVLIEGVTPGSPAEKAGLQGGDHFETVRDSAVCVGGDIIVAINGEFIKDMDELLSYMVVNTHPGETVKLLIVRETESFEVSVLLEGRPQSPAQIQPCE
jgi:S1-C subfamily serine protease